MNKTQTQLNAERAWRDALIKFVEYDSAFNVNHIATKLVGVEFNKEGEMIERGKSYAYLTRHTPSMFGLWRAAYMEVCNGKDETKIHTGRTEAKKNHRGDSKKKHRKSNRKNTNPKAVSTVSS